MWDWMKSHATEIALASGLMVGLAIVAVPWVVLRLPVDALRRPTPVKTLRRRHPVLRALVFVLRNAVGLPLLILGVVMLVTPGQGVLTILFALGVMDFPGKGRLERAILERKSVLRGLNWIRRTGGKPELLPPG